MSLISNESRVTIQNLIIPFVVKNMIFQKKFLYIIFNIAYS